MKIRGFTLAEILITLGIIGIVAAMTIPTLITNYQKKSTATQLKKAYSMLVNASKQAIADDNLTYNAPEVYDVTLDKHDQYGIFATYFAPYMSGSTVKKGNWHIKTPAGVKVFTGANFLNGYYLANNGMCFVMTNHGPIYFYIVVDLNGPSGPNRVGRDVFYFALHFADTGVKIDGNVYLVDNNTSRDELIKQCGKEKADWSGGSTCTELIMRDGWVISKDYPW
ncbi:MAG: prepilin-type N-terminal cleavage/methylation domain-containing protein [Muribaculaceae bacterium]|nr:prepilin-type N-terminal cleavage/methylation domain-containing protein [Muribaculaceae bacterium]